MDKLKVCIGSNHGINIAQTHMGDTKFFYIYEIFRNSDYFFIDKRINTAIDMDHSNEDKMKSILSIVDDVDILVAEKLSPNFKKIAKTTKYQPIVIKTESIEDGINIICKNFDEIYTQIQNKKSGFINQTILQY
ncbi:MAG: hypothetical protein JXR64_07060 [Spirochaetales bacterium]|nr:hypothetical protein [Spirochaetales bacterium]